MTEQVINALMHKVGELTLDKIKLEIENAELKDELEHSVPVYMSAEDFLKTKEALKNE